MPREIGKLTWPLPWWVVVLPAILVMVISYLVVGEGRDWAYTAPAKLSGLAKQSLLFIGPITSVSAAWIAERFTNRHSPLSDPILPRGRGAQGLTILAVIGTYWGCAFLWVFGFPLAYAYIFVGPSTNLEYFLFPTIQSSNHKPLQTSLMALLVVWWICVLVAMVLLLKKWFATRSGASMRLMTFPIALIVACGFVGLIMPKILPSPFIDGRPTTLSCEPALGIEVCVTKEQELVLPEVLAQSLEFLAQFDEIIPDEIHMIVSSYGIPEAEDRGLNDLELLTINVGPHGFQTLEFDLAASLGGVPACSPQFSGQDSINWSFAVASWLLPDNPLSHGEAPQVQQINAVSLESALSWYETNQRELRACEYKGSGPQ